MSNEQFDNLNSPDVFGEVVLWISILFRVGLLAFALGLAAGLFLVASWIPPVAWYGGDAPLLVVLLGTVFACASAIWLVFGGGWSWLLELWEDVTFSN